MVEVYDLDLELKAVLHNASQIDVETTINKPSSSGVSFVLPYDDPKLKECEVFRFVRVRDATDDYGFYRVLPKDTEHTNSGTESITCEPAIATLVDDILPMYHQIGNIGVFTRDVIEYILGFQTVKYWQLGDCDFDRQFEYSWENESLLGALWSVANPITDDYMWVYDFSTTPWTIHLKALDVTGDPKSYFRYKKNIQSMRREVDPTELCTKLMPLGYGEGINQLTIAEVNGGDLYLYAKPENIARYGWKTKVLTDRRFQYADTLMEYGQKQLDALQEPRVTYSMNIVDLHPTTHDPYDQPRVGDLTRAIDNEIGIDIKRPLTSVKIADLLGPGRSTSATVANTEESIAGTIADLNNRQKIEQTYAQGATNIYVQSFNDNAASRHPAKLRFWVPSGTVRVNSVMAIIETAPFRAYSTSATAYGGYNITSESNLQQTSENSEYLVASSGGGGSATSGPIEQASSSTSDVYTGGMLNIISWDNSTVNQMGMQYEVGGGYAYTGVTNSHSHDFSHQHTFATSHLSHTHSINHSHTVPVGAHRHSVTYPAHTHNVGTHTHTIRPHTHIVPFPTHSHGIEYGIYEGTKATAVTIKVNNIEVPNYTLGEEIDLAPFMYVNGKVQTGTHYTIEITPDNLTRIEATITMQLFIQSHGAA